MRFTVSAAIVGLAVGTLATSGAAADTPQGEPKPITAPIDNPAVPAGLQVWDIDSLDLNFPEPGASAAADAAPPHMICGAHTEPPVAGCATVINNMRSLKSSLVVQQGTCVGISMGGCNGMLCADGQTSLSTTTDWIADELTALFGYCVFPSGEEGWGFDCYTPRGQCSNWGVYLQHA